MLTVFLLIKGLTRTATWGNPTIDSPEIFKNIYICRVQHRVTIGFPLPRKQAAACGPESGRTFSVIVRCGSMLAFFCRCNNVLYIKGAEEEDEDGEMKE